LKFSDLQFIFADLVKQVDLLIVRKFLAGIFGKIEGRDD
jgi:hypothetical protein